MPTLLSHVLAFAGAALLLAIAPGPATAVLLRQTIRHGRVRGMATVGGIEAGVFFWAVTAALGLTAVLAASEVAYMVLRICGALTLIGLGVQALLRSRRPHPDIDPATEGAEAGSNWRAFRAGMVTNVANPKAGVFAVSFLPQFIPRGAAVLPTGLLLAAVWVACDGGWYIGLTSAIHAARNWFSRGPLRRQLERWSGVALIGFGVRLAVERS